MVAVIIFAIHFLALGYAFHVRKKEAGVGEGLLAVAFIVIIFSVGWTIMTMLTGLTFDPEGLAVWLDRDAIALVFLTIGEAVFYYFYLRSERNDEKKREKN